MSALRHNLRRLLSPRHIAFIGGSDADFSARQCAALFDGQVWGVNPGRNSLGGLPCYNSIEDLPEAPDAVFLATPRAAATDTVRCLSRMGAGGVACFTAGFGELGVSGQQAEAELVAAAGEMALVGPNCYGVINFTNGALLWPFGAGDSRCDKGVALIMQSGMLPANLIMNDRSVPISYVVSAGNQAVLAIEDYMDLLVDEASVTAIGLYIEGIRDIHKFAEVAIRAITANKPVVVLKAGKSVLGSSISITHTGSLAGADEAFQALFEQLGMIRVNSPVEMLETLKFLSVSGAPKGNRLAVFTCSGGDAAMVADYCERVGLELSPPSADCAGNLAQRLPDIATPTNPLDYTTPLWGNSEAMPGVFQALMQDDYDAAVVIQDFPPPRIHADNSLYRSDASSFIQACNAVGIPGAVCSDLPENIDRETRDLVIAGGVTPLQGLDSGLDAIANACRYGMARERMVGADGVPEFRLIAAPDRQAASRIVDEWQGKTRLQACGIDIPAGQVVDIEAVREISGQLSFPVVLKALSAELPHKSEVGAVRVNLQNADQLCHAVEAMRHSISEAAPAVDFNQVLVESMVEDVIAELMIGINTDAQFGQLLVIASGGVLVELTRDATTLLLPASDAQIYSALRQLRCFRLLQGFRGKPAADIDRIISSIRALIGFAESQQASLVEIDINPLMITPQACIAADVMIREITT
ncbi:MAG: acetate--CoA ligase family protein [Gammaproteobacteria bacterium]|nr:acetate--CoA ligase family protein [Gammaproteobacteria bacterium]